ncbi:hypothetical protein CYMTET_36181 [Cymbomonas tetramitiformis]|uniref:Ion transport domain-containing protein n=1 Tax=Cymbomonas tetramitiformis TaxID=36881 RepID=A0AAE0CGG2_9CHLO|nr:hypothetical protein CYMTET_36181 [Cymbomonas tetramitiformis]
MLLRPQLAIAYFREQVANWLRSDIGETWEHGLAAVAIIACFLYVGETYIFDGIRCGRVEDGTSTADTFDDDVKESCSDLSWQWRLAEALVAVLFTVDYMFQLMAAESTLMHVVSLESIVDLLSICPVLTIFLPSLQVSHPRPPRLATSDPSQS